MTNNNQWLTEILDKLRGAQLNPTDLETWDAAKTQILQKISEDSKVTGDTSDGYHTFNELYEFRKLYNALLFNEWASQKKYKVVKSVCHGDGKYCFGGGWFIVVAQLPTGQVSNHYELKDWELFAVSEVPRSPEWDGHTAEDVTKRLNELALHQASLGKEGE